MRRFYAVLQETHPGKRIRGYTVKKLIKDWDELLAYEKIFRILTMVFAGTAVVVFFLYLLDKAEMAIMQLSIGLMILCQGIHLYRKHKKVAIISLCSAVIIMLAVIILAIL